MLAWLAEPMLQRSVESILGSEKVDVEVILVDNGCTTDDVEVLSRLPRVTAVGEGTNLGFAGGCNLGVAAATGEYVALINGDAVSSRGPWPVWCRSCDRPEVGIAAGDGATGRRPDAAQLQREHGARSRDQLGRRLVEQDTRTEPTETAGAMGACLVTLELTGTGSAASTRTTSPTTRMLSSRSVPGGLGLRSSMCRMRSRCTGTSSAVTPTSTTWSSATD